MTKLATPQIGANVDGTGYRVFAVIELHANGWTVAAHCRTRSQPYVTWHADMLADTGLCYWSGHYHSDLAPCLADLAERSSSASR